MKTQQLLFIIKQKKRKERKTDKTDQLDKNKQKKPNRKPETDTKAVIRSLGIS